MQLRQLERMLTVVERTLRKEFPADFHKRCGYAAFGLRALLDDAGIEAEAMGGDFAALIITRDGNPAMHGFAHGQEQCAHFWIELPDRLIDLGPYFLPNEASSPIAQMPAVAWDKTHPLPHYLRYRPLLRFPKDAEMAEDQTIKARSTRFIEQCRQRMAGQVGPAKFTTWIVTGPASAQIAANKRDLWALGAVKFQTWVDPAKLPF